MPSEGVNTLLPRMVFKLMLDRVSNLCYNWDMNKGTQMIKELATEVAQAALFVAVAFGPFFYYILTKVWDDT